MAGAKPEAYGWLGEEDFAFEVACCLTVVAGDDRRRLGAAFGSDLAEPVGEPRTIGDFAAFVTTPSGVVAVEDNGFQGTRSAVLVEASRTSANGKAASICWNVNGDVTFSCAARGKLVASVELGLVDDPEDLPRSLRRLAVLAEGDDADLVAIGAAMVETYTGTGFTRSDLSAPAPWYLLKPPLDLLPVSTASSTGLNFLYFLEGRETEVAALVAAIGGLDPARQRRLAEWTAEATIAQAALGPVGERYASVCAGFGPEGPPEVPTPLVVYMQKVERATTAAYTESSTKGTDPDDDPRPEVALAWLGQVNTVGSMLRYACHQDPTTAAWETVYLAHRSLSGNARLGGSDRSLHLSHAIAAFLEDPAMTRAAFLDSFPNPYAAATRDELLARERREFAEARAEWLEEWSGMGSHGGPMQPPSLPA